MGYTTEFQGQFSLDKPLEDEHRVYLKKFNETRRVQRDATKLPADPIRDSVGLVAGLDGGYYVSATELFGQDQSCPSVKNYNQPPSGQPGLWCCWVPNEDGTSIIWDGAEKFYDYVAWIDYLIKHFLEPWGYVVNGEMKWRGEDFDDSGTIIVKHNHVTTSDD